MSKDGRRERRRDAVKSFNNLAVASSLDALKIRPAPTELQSLYAKLCKALPQARWEELKAARLTWCDNGGADLDLGLLPGAGTQDADKATDDCPDGAEPLPSHTQLVSLQGRAFRLHSRAFMLTFNSMGFVLSVGLWTSFCAWVVAKAKEFKAKHWSATLEESKLSEDVGRVHCHAYFSWHGAGSKGIDHTTTDAWVFQGVRPRVDKNTEARGPWRWLRATQHGHFYVQVNKEGTLYSATSYAVWESWVPDAIWVTKLWKEHKLGHEAYLRLSVRLREGHERRKACVEAVIADELAEVVAAERSEARRVLAVTQKPFKPLPDKAQAWRLQYDGPKKERYQLLVLFGPSCTGKSRLARSLFGEEHTLVVDVQHAEHPDLRGYKRHVHRAVLLDEATSPKFVCMNKKLLQAHADGAKLGQSATQLFAYNVFLWATPLMVTTNNWDYATFAAADQDWLRTNCVEVFVGEPVYEDVPGGPQPLLEPSPRRILSKGGH
jgi:hypothetical protein